MTAVHDDDLIADDEVHVPAPLGIDLDEGRGNCHHGARVTGRGASLEDDHVCASMERALTQQPADRGGINIVSASDISLRLATGQPLQCFLPLMRRHLARTAEPNTPLLRPLAALASAGED
jgi:hypothetical protein